MASFFNGDDRMEHPDNPKASFFNRSLTIHHPRAGLSSYEYAALERMGSVKKLHNSPFGSISSAGNSFKGKVKKLCSLFEKAPQNSPESQSLQTSPLPSPKPAKVQNSDYSSDSFFPFRLPGTEDRVVIYFTSLRGIRKTYADCYAVRMIFKGFRVNIDERDISMDSAYKKELQNVLGEKTVSLPQVFIKGKHIGGADVVRQLNETGELAKLLKGLPIRTLKPGLGYMCDGCGDMRFVPCPNCNGSRKVFDEDEEQLKRCPDCNENGLVRCPECCS
ncbi:hypothetical protein M9H77_03045 [Catharanthus roseus]|uniref:Uncharacterized protein n=1 Tax=Catharanthus roseus TaxID=4058 RepID=A0ACC0CA46_CATRO|nr:hypothetical protein M9H77_03045 [Catharanthus roseus]